VRKIAVTNQKGGSGKTTTAVNLAAALGQKGRKVLLVDLDPQSSATTWLGLKFDGPQLFEVFTTRKPIADIILATNSPGVKAVPSSAWLVGLETTLAKEVGNESILKRKIEGLNEFDYILIDCPPSLGILTINALVASDEVLIPVETHVMALSGLVQLIDTVSKVKERLHPSLSIAGIVPCRVDSRTRHSKEVLDQLRRRFKDQMYKTAIRENVRLAEAPSFGKDILRYDPDCNGAEDFRSLAREVMKQEKILART